jgi:hypothetical protein
MRVFVTLGALLALGPFGGAAAGEPTAAALPQGSWSLKVCMAFGPTTDTPCVYLTEKLILRVENASGPPPPQRKIVFEQPISPESARQIYSHALSAIRSVGDVQGELGIDGADVRITLTFPATRAEVHFSSSNLEDAGPEVRGLVGLLREITHAL